MHIISSSEFEASPCLAKTIVPNYKKQGSYYNCWAFCDGSIENCISNPYCGEGLPGSNLVAIINKFLCDVELSKHTFGVYVEVLHQFVSFLNTPWKCIKCECWLLNAGTPPGLKHMNAYTLTHGLDCLKYAVSFCKGLNQPKIER